MPAGGVVAPEPPPPPPRPQPPRRKAAPPPPPPEPEPEEDFEDDGYGEDEPNWDDAEHDEYDSDASDSPLEDDAPSVPMEMAPTSGKKARDPLDGYDSDIPMESGSGRSQQASILDDDPLSGLDFGDSSAFGSANSDDDDMPSRNRNSALDSQEIDTLLASGPQPIADLFGRDPDEDDYEENSGKGKGGLIALLLILLMAGLGAGAWFGRSTVVSMVPALEPLYAMVGIEVDVSSAGLVFQDVTLDRQSVSGIDVLVVRGFITNESDGMRTLPYLSLVLFDRTDAPVQRTVSEPPQKTLEAGQTTGFRIKLESPSASATRFEVFWTKAPPTPGGPPTS
jgi:hypothetical protein